ncbi:MAG TPA: peptidyl-prolyl cis-trans isomerase [Candidatus Eubacterium faecigallinarum]|nr:peptidyl-prolyl cis-trans isomerase [Candidatus Eubacterium faecigallinarum]
MDEKENKLNEELAAENKNETAEAQQPQENETSLEEKDGVKYETNDNWKFDAEAPTLNNDMFEGIDESAYDIQKNSAQNNKVPEKYVYSNDSDNIVIKREPLTFIPLAVFVAVVIIVLSVLGVRYYTVPNGKEGNLMNPASVAAVVDGNKVSLGMYNLYFSSVVSQYEQYANYGYYDLDTTEDYSKQYTTDEDGNKITWLDYFEQETMNQIKLYNAFYNKAVDSGITLTEAQQQSINEQIDSFKTTASDEGVSLDDYISDVFGDYCTEETVELYMEQFYMSVNYKGKYAAENRPDDKEIDAYYEEHQNDYYQINFSYLATTYDTTSEETKAESEKLIQNYMSKITDRQSIIDLVPTAYADYIEQDAQSYMESDSSITEEEAKEQALATYEANVDGTIYGTDKPFGDDINDWLFDENEPTGQVKYYINEETGYAYIILKTEQPTRIEDETYSVRHILIMPEADESQTDSTTGETEYTDEQWAAAEEKAQSILDEFNSGDKTEYSFALLAEANSEDTASTTAGSSDAFGGLYEGVGLGEMVTEFEEWATDDSRKYGDTGIVKSDYGYHIMFFIDDCPSYESQIITDIRNAKFDEIAENADIEIHDSVVDKANEKFLNEKRAGNSSDTSSSDTASAN